MSIIKTMCLTVVEAYNTKEGQMKQQTLSREAGVASWRQWHWSWVLEVEKARDLNIYGGSKNNKEVRVVGDCTKNWQTDKTRKEMCAIQNGPWMSC